MQESLSQIAMIVTGHAIKVSCDRSDAVLICGRKHRHVFIAANDGTLQLTRSIGRPLQKSDRCQMTKRVVKQALV